MSTVPPRMAVSKNGYPTADGKPMAETDWHRKLMTDLIEILKTYYAGQRVYVSGNLLVYYEPGNRRRRVSPDVFVVRGVENYPRPNYLLWEEGKGPEVIIELTSSKTAHEDRTTKRTLYQDTLRLPEKYLFPLRKDYLDPPLQGFRLHKGVYHPIRPIHGRLPSQVLGLHLERDGEILRLWNPLTQSWLPKQETLLEKALARADAERRAEQSEAENERLRREIAELRRRLNEDA